MYDRAFEGGLIGSARRLPVWRVGLETACRICGLHTGQVRFEDHGLALFVMCECCCTEFGDGGGTWLSAAAFVTVGSFEPKVDRSTGNWEQLRKIPLSSH